MLHDFVDDLQTDAVLLKVNSIKLLRNLDRVGKHLGVVCCNLLDFAQDVGAGSLALTSFNDSNLLDVLEEVVRAEIKAHTF